MPLAREGLSSIGIDADEADYWLGIVQARISSGQNGAAWQRAWVGKNGSDMQGLMETYLERQASARPVHEWAV